MCGTPRDLSGNTQTDVSCVGKGYSGTFGGDGQLLYTAFTTERNGI
jgi:hypothetical protein